MKHDPHVRDHETLYFMSYMKTFACASCLHICRAHFHMSMFTNNALSSVLHLDPRGFLVPSLSHQRQQGSRLRSHLHKGVIWQPDQQHKLLPQPAPGSGCSLPLSSSLHSLARVAVRKSARKKWRARKNVAAIIGDETPPCTQEKGGNTSSTFSKSSCTLLSSDDLREEDTVDEDREALRWFPEWHKQHSASERERGAGVHAVITLVFSLHNTCINNKDIQGDLHESDTIKSSDITDSWG